MLVNSGSAETPEETMMESTYPRDERRQLPPKRKPKTAKNPKKLITETKVVPVDCIYSATMG
jgi:hypothetical protein